LDFYVMLNLLPLLTEIFIIPFSGFGIRWWRVGYGFVQPPLK